MIEQNTNNNTWHNRKIIKGYTIFYVPEKKTEQKDEGKRMWLGSISSRFQPQFRTNFTPCTVRYSRESYVINKMDYNYKLRSVIEQEDNSTTNKRKWFDKKVSATFS